METKVYKGFPKEAYKKVATKPEGYGICIADYNRSVGRRRANAKKSRETEFLEIGENEFIDKALIETGLEELKTKLNINDGEARAVITELEKSGHAVYNSYSSWTLTADGYKKYGDWDVALGIKLKVEPIAITEYMKDIPKIETEIEKPEVVETKPEPIEVETKTEIKTPKVEIKKEWYKMANNDIVYESLFDEMIEMGKTVAIKVAVSKSNAKDAKPLLNVRKWFLPKGETDTSKMRPTKDGFAVQATPEKIDAIIEALKESKAVL